MRGLTARFLKFATRYEPDFDKGLGIYPNGENNNYPNRVERTIEESVTASQCFDLMSDYISGRGFGDAFDKKIINTEKGITGRGFTDDISDSWTMFSGVFIHLNFDGDFNIINPSVLPFTDCRIGKKDDNRYNGKILVCENWHDTKAKRTAIDVYNPNKKVIAEQVRKAGGIEQYKGQILYIKKGSKTYPLSRIHPALLDADSEAQTSIYKNKSLRKGFFGKTLIVTRPMVDGSLKETHQKEYKEQLSERDAFRDTITQFIGAENVDGVMHMELEFQEDDIEKEIMFKNIDSNINDKLFAHTEKSVADNIRACFKNVPAPLVKSQEGGLFGDNISQAKLFYQDQTHNDRMVVQEIVRTVMARHQEPMTDLNIIPLIEDANRQNGNSEA